MKRGGALLLVLLAAGCSAPPYTVHWSQIPGEPDPGPALPLLLQELLLVSAPAILGPWGAVVLLPFAIEADALDRDRRRTERYGALADDYDRYLRAREDADRAAGPRPVIEAIPMTIPADAPARTEAERDP